MDQPRQLDGMYFSGVPVQVHSAVVPFQLGDKLSEMPVVPSAAVPLTLITPVAEEEPPAINLVGSMLRIAKPAHAPVS